MPTAATTAARVMAHRPLSQRNRTCTAVLHCQCRDGACLVDRQMRQHRSDQTAGALIKPAECPAGQTGDQHRGHDGFTGAARVRDMRQPERRRLDEPATRRPERVGGDGAQRTAVGRLLRRRRFPTGYRATATGPPRRAGRDRPSPPAPAATPWPPRRPARPGPRRQGRTAHLSPDVEVRPERA